MISVKRIVPLKDAKSGDLPIAHSTCYKNLSLGMYPHLIYKVPGVGVVFDFDEWDMMCETAKAEHVKKSERIRRPLGEV
jgi:hypothetical protein